jgi:CDP-paratose 2-epimerase
MSCIAGPHQFGNEDQGWVAHFLYSALQNTPLVIYGDGRQVRDVLCVDDLLRAFEAVRANVASCAGEIFNVGGGPENSVSLLELIAMIEKLTGRRVEYVRDERRPGDQLIYVTDYSRLTRFTSWKPEISVAGTLDLIYAWWRRHRELIVPVEAQILPATIALQERAAS